MAHEKYIARVLIVDDDASLCEMLSEKLRLEGYDCRTCLSGEEGLAQLQKESFDVILSDLRMPAMSGLRLMEVARHERPEAAFILVTGNDDVRVATEAMKNGAYDYVIKPFRLESVLHGITNALHKKHLEIEVDRYRRHLEEMVTQRTQQLKKALQQIEETYDQTLEALGAALDLRDASTAGHCARVASYTLKIARSMACGPEQLREIRRAAYLHDIGKIGIPDGILLKNGALTGEEQEIMRTHVTIGYELVKRIVFLQPAAEIVLAHQERFDGSGYPRGLRGQDIPLGARIFSLADTLDAMTSDRPYRKAVLLDTAIEEIERESGQQFDPKVVGVFLSIPQKCWRKIQASTAQSTAVN